ncbi:hypothetical protein NLU13_4170 [Sarocladium strictum]|uniref:Uncharacterized protein n=1 Tax=Sarocladium strictum TaxID=5046 RepID=A0AA39GID1_SARSR|nr:hypothetical protein NLU13_4170 [Sarocladium strictum]
MSVEVGNLTVFLEDLQKKHRSAFHALWSDRWCARQSGRQASGSEEQSKRVFRTLTADAKPENFWVDQKAIMVRVTDATATVPAECVGIIYTDSPSTSGLTIKFEIMSHWNGYGIASHAVPLFLHSYWQFVRSAPFRKVFVRNPRLASSQVGPGRNTAVRLSSLSATFQRGNNRAKRVLDKVGNAFFSHTGPSTETYIITAPF